MWVPNYKSLSNKGRRSKLLHFKKPSNSTQLNRSKSLQDYHKHLKLVQSQRNNQSGVSGPLLNQRKFFQPGFHTDLPTVLKNKSVAEFFSKLKNCVSQSIKSPTKSYGGNSTWHLEYHFFLSIFSLYAYVNIWYFLRISVNIFFWSNMYITYMNVEILTR